MRWTWTDAHKERFMKNVENLVLSFESFVNPFKTKVEGLLNISTHQIMVPEAAESVENAKNLGRKQHNLFA